MVDTAFWVGGCVLVVGYTAVDFFFWVCRGSGCPKLDDFDVKNKTANASKEGGVGGRGGHEDAQGCVAVLQGVGVFSVVWGWRM